MHLRHLTRCCIVYRQIRRTPSPEPGPLRWVQQEPSAIATRCFVCGHFPCVHEYFLLADAGRSHAACGACVTSPCSPRAPASRAGGRWSLDRTGPGRRESRASIYQPSSSISHRPHASPLQKPDSCRHQWPTGGQIQIEVGSLTDHFERALDCASWIDEGAATRRQLLEALWLS